MRTLRPVDDATKARIGEAYLICAQYPEVFEGIAYRKFCGLFVDDILDEGEDLHEARKKAAAHEMYDLLEDAVKVLAYQDANSKIAARIERLLDEIDEVQG